MCGHPCKAAFVPPFCIGVGGLPGASLWRVCEMQASPFPPLLLGGDGVLAKRHVQGVAAPDMASLSSPAAVKPASCGSRPLGLVNLVHDMRVRFHAHVMVGLTLKPGFCCFGGHCGHRNWLHGYLTGGH